MKKAIAFLKKREYFTPKEAFMLKALISNHRTALAKGLFLLTLSTIAGSLSAQDPSCDKNCGAGMPYSTGDRPGCGCSYCCSWTLCINHSQFCEGYSDNFVDACGHAYCWGV